MRKLFFIILLLATYLLQAQIRYCPRRIVPGDPRNYGQEQQLIQADQQRRMVESRQITTSTPGICTRTLPPRVLVVMVNFANYSFFIDHDHADSLFNAQTMLHSNMGHKKGGFVVEHGSVAAYFASQSLGQYRPIFDVVGPVTVSKNYNQYANKEFSLAKEACSLVNDSVDFTQYDADKDGFIDLVFIYYAGFGKNDQDYIDSRFKLDVANLVWPHYSDNSSSSADYDGKKLRAYECCNEMDGYLSVPDTLVPSGCGILVHEFSHGIGLPDVYHSSGATQYLYMGSWDLMDYGCYNMETYVPAPYTGWERWFCGWSKPQWMNSPKDVTLRPISQSGDFGVITSNGLPCDSFNTSTYWIVENHQSNGWDQYAYGAGLLLYQLKFHNGWKSNSVNNENSKNYVLVPADGTWRAPNGWVGKQGDCYPYLDNDSIVLSAASNYPITHINQQANGDITFKVCGGQATGIEAIEQEGETITKLLINGVIYIRRGNKLYTITGNETHIL